MARARIGCSGYEYAGWRARFYPVDVPHRAWFAWYASCFDTVELNATFYRLPTGSTVEAWRDRAPAGFVHAVKCSRYGTHRKRLTDPDTWLPAFVERIAPLGPALGPVLVQLPPRWRANPARLEAFLAVAPVGLRWAVEVRDPSWLCEGVYEVLARHDAALVRHDLIADHPDVTTASWAYRRFHGPLATEHAYQHAYPEAALAEAARWVCAHLDAGRDVYCYFNNDVEAHAPRDAVRLRELVTGAT